MKKTLRFLDEIFNKQKTADLYNGTTVQEGDMITYLNSDGIKYKAPIQRRTRDYELQSDVFRPGYTNNVLKKGTLYFLNPEYLITDYKTAEKL